VPSVEEAIAMPCLCLTVPDVPALVLVLIIKPTINAMMKQGMASSSCSSPGVTLATVARFDGLGFKKKNNVKTP